MTSIWILFLLAIIQALTEFLPVSSSGHLAIVQLIIKSFKEPPVLFDLFLHLGTLIATIIYFRRQIIEIFQIIKENYTKPQKFIWFYSKSNNILSALLWGTAATGAIAFPLINLSEKAFTNYIYIILAFFITAIILYLTKFAKEDSNINIAGKEAILIGIFQGIAIFPGISRSAMTISIALLLGIEKRKAFNYSFLLSIPAIGGSLIIESFSYKNNLANNISSYLYSSLIAFIIGYVSLIILKRLIEKSRFYYFSYYCLLIAIIFSIYFYASH